MYYAKSFFFILCFICSVVACAQERELAAKDDPAVPATNNINNPIIQDLLMNSESIEAYTFEKNGWKTLKDTTSTITKGFKPLQHIKKLQAPERKKLKEILGAETSYESGDEIAKCGWYPDLEFILKKEEKQLTVLVSTINNCNVIKIYQEEEKLLVKMCRPARTNFVALAKILFPEVYELVPLTLETPETIPVDTLQVPPNDSTQQNNTNNQE